MNRREFLKRAAGCGAAMGGSNTTRREAYVTRGPACRNRWKTFRFENA